MTFSPASYVSATTTVLAYPAASSTQTVLECLDIACYLLFIGGYFAIMCRDCGIICVSTEAVSRRTDWLWRV